LQKNQYLLGYALLAVSSGVPIALHSNHIAKFKVCRNAWSFVRIAVGFSDHQDKHMLYDDVDSTKSLLLSVLV